MAALEELPPWGAELVSVAEMCNEGKEYACAALSSEARAKLAWLAKQTAPRTFQRGVVEPFASPPPPVASTEVLAQGERLLQGTGLNLTPQEKEAVRRAMEIIRRQE